MMKFLWSEVGSPLRNDVFTARWMLIEKEALSKWKNHFSLGVVADLPSLLGFFSVLPTFLRLIWEYEVLRGAFKFRFLVW